MKYQIGQQVSTSFTDRDGKARLGEIVKIRPGHCAPYQVRFEHGFEYAFDAYQLRPAPSTPPSDEPCKVALIVCPGCDGYTCPDTTPAPTHADTPSEMYYKVRLHFADQSSAISYVPEDEDIAAWIADECEELGWDAQVLVGYTLITHEATYTKEELVAPSDRARACSACGGNKTF